jgi:HD-GYP domain-containing protein (c-di-GMP phosphodiesterase class II)
MTIGTIDVFSTLAFLSTAVCIAYAAARFPAKIPRIPAALGVLAMLVMTTVSVGNALMNLGITAAPHATEEAVEVLFLPLVVYLMYSLYSYSERRRTEKERAIVRELDERLEGSLSELEHSRLETLQALSAAVDARDHYTAQHSLHVADYACAIGYRLGMRDQLTLLEQAGLLHDIGKVGVPDHVLLKPAQLTDEEYEVVKRHAAVSSTIIGTVPFLSAVLPAVRHHHERWDGGGYPDGLAGEEIPPASRVLAVADAFDAMTTDRPYRLALDVAEARAVLLRCSGKQFEPRAVEALIALLDEGVLVVESRPAA